MAKQIFSNGASATLATSIVGTDTTVQVQAGYGNLYPSPTGGDWFTITLEDSAANIEVCKCTARTGDLLTVVRAQEGTLAQDFTNTLTRVELRNTKGAMERFLQRSGDTLAGDLELGGFNLSGPGGLGPDVAIPKASVFPVGLIVMWSGSVGTIPAGWALCNGSNGTPDLRDKFILGAGGATPPGTAGGGGPPSATINAGGGHTPVAQGTALSVSNLPAHHHRLWGTYSGGQGDTEPLANSGSAVAGNTDGSKQWIEKTASNQQLVEDTGVTGSGATHTHVMDAVADHTHTATVAVELPPFYALAFIMFTG